MPHRLLNAGLATRLRAWRSDRGLTQSKLAKEIWGEVRDSRGYKSAKNRDRISAWEAKRARPGRSNLQKLSEFFSVDIKELEMGALVDSMSTDKKGVVSNLLDGHVDLKLNDRVSVSAAVKILKILEAERPK